MIFFQLAVDKIRKPRWIDCTVQVLPANVQANHINTGDIFQAIAVIN